MTTNPPPGLGARRYGYCARCDEPITPGMRIVYSAGRPIRVECHSGADR